jgi:hypothetical protein
MSIFGLLETMLVEHRHSFSFKDFSLISQKLDELKLYSQLLVSENLPIRLLNFVSTEKEDCLYLLSEILDKYTLEETELKSLIVEVEKLAKSTRLLSVGLSDMFG